MVITKEETGRRQKPAYAYTEAGVDKKFTSADRAVVGVDNYDHFVAKPHDYNEIVATDVLRVKLSDRGLASLSESTLVVNGVDRPV
jgi:hypothetical protein